MDNIKLLEQIITMVSEILEVDEDQIDPNTHLQELGINSLSLIKLVDKISDALDDDIHPGIFLEHTTITKFVSYLQEYKFQEVSRYLATILSEDSSIPDQKVQIPSTKQGQESDIEDNEWASIEENFLNPERTEETSIQKTSMNTAEKASEPLPDKVPVIIGGGIAAMLISHRLCQENIHHIVIGPPQLGDGPKLGESMTEAVTIEFTRNFKKYSQYFFSKEVTPFYLGNVVAGLRFDSFRSIVKIFLEEDIPKNFIHIDRLGFDQALYEEVIQKKECHWINDWVSDVNYCETSDQIKSITLNNNRQITPSYVWDCTNHVRLLGKKLKIPFEDLDPQRQVIFTHYFEKDAQKHCEKEHIPWMQATSLLRADENFDSLQGISWLIPLGSYVSVGISMSPEDIGDKTPEEIITALTKAYQNRGTDYTKYFPRRKEIINIPSQHFMYDRFFGENWALVGGSAASTWFPSGSNIGIIVCMASMADKIINQPKVYGTYYSRHVEGFAQTHKIYNTLLNSNVGALDAIKFLSDLIDQGRKRICSYFMFRDGLDSEVSKIATELWEEETVIDKKYFEFLKQIATHTLSENRKQQTASIFENFSKLKEKNPNVTLPYFRNSNICNEKADLFLS